MGHKIGKDDRQLYGKLHSGDPYLHSLTGGDTARLHELLALCTRCVAWRSTAGASGNRVTDKQVRAAELFEDVLQQPRLNMLRRLFPAASEVCFIPSVHSLQNRCLLAGSEAALQQAKEPPEAFLQALRKARSDLLAATGGSPLDLKPKGFVSSKYEYDG